MTGTESTTPERPTPAWCSAVVVGSAVLGLALIADQAGRMSATYDEVAYLRVAARWWRTGDQAEMTRLGSPLTFFKVQQAPTLWVLDRLGYGGWVDDPIEHQAELLPVVRLGACWTWPVALALVATWARRLYGPRAMAMAASLFALSPNLLAHGTLATMELPLVAASTGVYLAFWSFLRSGSRRAFFAAAILGGLAFSCKFTTVLIPPILAALWSVELWTRRDRSAGVGRNVARVARVVAPGMVAFGLVMVLTDLVLTGFATLPLSGRGGDHPLLAGKIPPRFAPWAGRVLEASYPADWVGFATQVVHQAGGGASYLLGERRTTGWWHYYLVCLAVKVPLGFWLLVLARGWARRGDRDWALPAIVSLFLLAAIVGSRRNYGVRYLLPIAAPAIVWVSGLAERGRWSKGLAVLGLAGMAVAVAAIHPRELTYFNALAGGPMGGRRILSDSNLDWGQGARGLARLQRDRPEFADLTLFYFGDTDPAWYGVVGLRYLIDANQTPADLPPGLAVDSPYLAVSASLQWGPWGPEGYFRPLDRLRPVAFTDDTTIAIYRAADLTAAIKPAATPIGRP